MDPVLKTLRGQCVKVGSDGTRSGWLTEDPGTLGLTADKPLMWVTDDFAMGDIVVFGLDTLHMTANNQSDEWRISVETRWQPLQDPYPPYYATK